MWIFSVSLGRLLSLFLFPAMHIQADNPAYTQVNVDSGKDLKTPAAKRDVPFRKILRTA